jgi:type I restriction enzyme S subunit
LRVRSRRTCWGLGMRSEWNEVSLGDVASIRRGSSPRPIINFMADNGMPWVKIADATENNSRFIDKTKEFIKEEGIARSVIVNKGDLILSNSGTAGLPKFMGLTACVHDGWQVFKELDGIDKEFLYYTLINIRSKLLFNAYDSTMKNLTLDMVREAKINLPPLATQKKIAHILSTLDDKIELNRKMNQTLEEMAQVLFKSWFVDFDPVRAKAEARSEAELEAKAAELGISKEVLDLFPSRLVESEMGMIPEGWEIKPFGELLSKTIGGDWGKEEPDDKHTEKVKIIRGTDIPKIKNISIEAVPTRYVEVKKLKTRELFDGDIVIEVSGGTKNQPTGRSLYITNEILEMLGNKVEPASFCRLFRPINAEIGLILGQHMLHIYDQGKTWQYQNQSTGISNFQTTIFLEKEHVLVPDAKVLTEFYKIVRPLIEKSLSSENITLQKTRDTLLPKLLSGELDVSEVEID